MRQRERGAVPASQRLARQVNASETERVEEVEEMAAVVRDVIVAVGTTRVAVADQVERDRAKARSEGVDVTCIRFEMAAAAVQGLGASGVPRVAVVPRVADQRAGGVEQTVVDGPGVDRRAVSGDVSL